MSLAGNGIRKLVHECAGLKAGEKVLVISDETTEEIGRVIADQAGSLTDHVAHKTISSLRVHGQEPPPPVASAMAYSDVIFGLTRMSLAHTRARFAASRKGARYLSLPDYSMEVLASAALQTDFQGLAQTAQDLAALLTAADKVRIKTAAGTDLTCSIKGRTANAHFGCCDGPGTLASPPDAETNIALIEDRSEGILIVDGSIPYPGLGLVTSPLKLIVRKGRVSEIEVQDGPGRRLRELLWGGQGQEKKRILAELGIGLNPQARLCGIMLIDEGALGTVHIGLGSNFSIGGQNQADFHLDLVIKDPTLTADEKTVMTGGQFA